MTVLELENKDLKGKLAETEESLAIIATAHNWCLSNKDVLGWTAEQVDRMREVSSLMSNAVHVRDTCSRLIENEKSGLRSMLDQVTQQLKSERSARLEAERKLASYLKQTRPSGVHRHDEPNRHRTQVTDSKQARNATSSQTSRSVFGGFAS